MNFHHLSSSLDCLTTNNAAFACICHFQVQNGEHHGSECVRVSAKCQMVTACNSLNLCFLTFLGTVRIAPFQLTSLLMCLWQQWPMISDDPRLTLAPAARPQLQAAGNARVMFSMWGPWCRWQMDLLGSPWISLDLLGSAWISWPWKVESGRSLALALSIFVSLAGRQQ
jgi:hypothetical protein